jgi:hypothetical protein
MTRGIYILANDKVRDNTIALVNSIRLYDPETPIVLIPYNQNYQAVAEAVLPYGVEIYENLQFVDSLIERTEQILGHSFLVERSLTQRLNLMRKLACWFGRFDEFLYIDTDIVVFEKIIDSLSFLSEYDFLWCDYQYTTGIKHVFTEKLIEDQVFSKEELKNLFNTGFWASKKNLFTEEELYQLLAECASKPEYFDWYCLDQTILNYLVLKRIPRRFNLVSQADNIPGNWAGTKNFKVQNGRLYDPKTNQPLSFIHWAGMSIEPGCPYWNVWEHYRYLNTSKPDSPPQTQTRSSLFEKILNKIKRLTQRI